MFALQPLLRTLRSLKYSYCFKAGAPENYSVIFLACVQPDYPFRVLFSHSTLLPFANK